MQKALWICEKLLGRGLTTLLGVIFSLPIFAQEPPLYLYHLSSEEFEATVHSDRFREAQDLELFKEYLATQYGLKEVQDEHLKEIVSNEDFEKYQEAVLNGTGACSGNPTCGGE